MRTVKAYRAQPIGSITVEPVTIDIDKVIPDLPVKLTAKEAIAEYDNIYHHQASRIEEALYNSLPGGTYDALLGRMLTRKASHFRVAHGERDNG